MIARGNHSIRPRSLEDDCSPESLLLASLLWTEMRAEQAAPPSQGARSTLRARAIGLEKESPGGVTNVKAGKRAVGRRL